MGLKLLDHDFSFLPLVYGFFLCDLFGILMELRRFKFC
jgi:hypothetical protein